MWTHRHLLGIEALGPSDIDEVLDCADEAFALSRQPVKKGAKLRGKTVINLFFEASTRTRTSFEIAGKRLGADVVNVSPSSSSVTKGETLLDTVRNLEAMHADALVLRHAASGAPHFLAARAAQSPRTGSLSALGRAAIINAGDGLHEHPTQALLDAFTIRRRFGKLSGLVVAICGDVLHSRVARSNALLLGKMGASVRFAGPLTMMPRGADQLGSSVTVCTRLEEAIEGADVVMMLRIQHERLNSAMIASTREYSRTFGLTARLMARAAPGAIVMHPGPINRGVEIDSRLADGDRSVILDQVEAGVAVRMAVLELVLTRAQQETKSERHDTLPNELLPDASR